MSLLDEVVDNGTSGAMLWSLRYHSKEGGFYFQGNRRDPANIYYNWPGFSSHAGGELEKLNYIRHCAYRIQGLPIPPKFVLEASILLTISIFDNIRWKGSAAAESYGVERALNPAEDWTIIVRGVLEDMQSYVPFQDKPGTDAIYYYRIRAENISGVSEPSNVQAFVARV
jgi:hypothetical protein